VIEGRVTNSAGQSLQNAHVLNITKKLGTITDNLGVFNVSIIISDLFFIFTF
jgi:hypothetical protein